MAVDEAVAQPRVTPVMAGYQLQHLFLRAPYTICSMPERRERNMKKIAVALLMVGSLSVAGQASAHGNGGDVVGALIGGAVLGAVVTSVLNPAPVVVSYWIFVRMPGVDTVGHPVSEHG